MHTAIKAIMIKTTTPTVMPMAVPFVLAACDPKILLPVEIEVTLVVEMENSDEAALASKPALLKLPAEHIPFKSVVIIKPH
jgi:hypothetical protein